MDIKSENICAIVLAAGDGTRMQFKKPKVLCEVLFKPLISWVVQNCMKSCINDICLICSEDNINYIKSKFKGDVKYRIQSQRLGTAHAVMQAKDFLESNNKQDVLVMLGDSPFIDEVNIKESYIEHISNKNNVTVITANIDNPFGYGRVINHNGKLRIIEEKDANDKERSIKMVNSGTMWFNKNELLAALGKIDNKNAKSEYYITDALNLFGEYNKAGYYAAKDSDAILGANTSKQLLYLNDIAKKKVMDKLIRGGVEFISKDGILIGADSAIGQGTTIYPNVIIKGCTTIGANCVLTPGTFIENSIIGSHCEIKSSYIINSAIGNNTRIGPFSHLRPNTILDKNTKIGNFVEIKNSKIGEKTSIAHLTYIGDAQIGGNVNFGCGCVTVNYDGENKHETIVGNDVFIGCNTNLIAPIKICDRAYVAAGSTVTDAVLEDDFAIARAKQITKRQYMKLNRKKQ